ncbi:MAG: bifunctional phosphoribosylaminoimidazolecarboxamide formyltransferase/IMP cyclohydrolase, partial [candidate division WOR-3 bacterium]|nr:bifunctional phosphoribosylaminoimidazolecarboxamide formyltransferase/IMP cyclohydrolase [candidate division WOR-3 bacterium]
DGILEFAKILADLEIEIIATSRTAKLLEENGILVCEVSNFTQSEEILGGRVKTIHPKIAGGILSFRKEPDISPIDIVVCNLYPFEEGLKNNLTLKEMIELIDIGGVTLLRSGAKNYEFVTVIPDKKYYPLVAKELVETQEVSLKTREFLAAKTFEFISYYDALIAEYFNRQFLSFNDRDFYTLGFAKSLALRYGENPHQKGYYYQNSFTKFQFHQIHGKVLSYNNLLDLDSAIGAVFEFSEPACVIVKHGSPCGVALGDNIESAYEKALACDQESAFGGIVALNRPVNVSVAQKMTEIFLEVIAAPEFLPDAQEILKKKKNLRLIQFAGPMDSLQLRSALGGILVQDRDLVVDDIAQWRVVSQRQPTVQELEELLFAFKAVKFVKSNGIVISKNKATVGICGGQTSRVRAVEIALKNARGRSENGVLASDGFFPFRDSIDLIAQHNIKAIVEPGGSINDAEIIKAADEYGLLLVFSGIRHFRH